jgi:hypothetical protein
MPIKDTTKALRLLLEEMATDLNKSEKGNRAAAQRVRTSSIKFAKIAKLFRKESVAEDRNERKSLAKIKKKPLFSASSRKK